MEIDTRAAVYSYIQGLLTASLRSEPSCIGVSSLLQVVQSAVNDACSDLARKWNTERAGPALERLPAEIVSACFRRLRFHDRVSVSHVSRDWRSAALADPLLWTTFTCPESADFDDQKTRQIIELLSAMLERSRPAPLALRLPKSNRGLSRLEERIIDVAGPDLPRIQSLEGSFEIYLRLNPDGAAMPHLQYLRLLTKPHFPNLVFHLPPSWGGNGAPLLRQLDLDGLALCIPPDCLPLNALAHLNFYCLSTLRDLSQEDQGTLASLFDYCPNLVTLEIHGVTEDTLLPPGPLPLNLIHVSLYAADGHRVDFGQPLRPWLAFPIRRLELYGSRTLGHPLGFFLHYCADPIEIEILHATTHVRQLVAADQEPCRYSVKPYSWHDGDQLRALRSGATAARLTSLKVYARHLGEVFRGRLTLPQLQTFEFQLDQYDAAPFPDALPHADFRIAAPRLRHVGVKIPVMSPDQAGVDGPCSRTLGVLRDHMRDLIQYDVAPLGTVVVSGPREVVAALPCTELAPLATAYVERTDQYT